MNESSPEVSSRVIIKLELLLDILTVNMMDDYIRLYVIYYIQEFLLII